MKPLKTIAFFLVFLAQVVVMAHNAIPHHHHHHLSSQTECTCHCHEHTSGGDMHLCDSESCETCTLLSDPFENHSQSFGQTILAQFTKIKYYLPENADNAFGTQLCIGKISQRISGSSGLRAPPSYM